MTNSSIGESSQTFSLGIWLAWWGSKSYWTRFPWQFIINRDSTALTFLFRVVSLGRCVELESIQARAWAKQVETRKAILSSDEEVSRWRPKKYKTYCCLLEWVWWNGWKMLVICATSMQFYLIFIGFALAFLAIMKPILALLNKDKITKQLARPMLSKRLKITFVLSHRERWGRSIPWYYN